MQMTAKATTTAFKAIKSMRRTGLDFNTIAKRLNAKKIKTARGLKWTIGNVQSTFYKLS